MALAASPASLGDETENLRQLRAMPRERRVALSENLERFDKLSPAEQDAIRKLDAQIARKDPIEQARYRSLLRSYHLWVNGLGEAEQEQLKAAEGTEARFNLASKFRKKELEMRPPGPRLYRIRTGNLGVKGPYEVAHLLKIWKLLTPQKRLEIERKQPASRMVDEIKAQQRFYPVPLQSLPEADEKRYMAELDGNPDVKRDLAVAKGKPTPRLNDLRLAEFLYFEEHKPRSVSPANLERFSVSCPGWLHEMLDSLSHDDARAYRTIVYRLPYPDAEMPAEARPSTAPKPSSDPPAVNKSGPAGPL